MREEPVHGNTPLETLSAALGAERGAGPPGAVPNGVSLAIGTARRIGARRATRRRRGNGAAAGIIVVRPVTEIVRLP